MLTDEEREDVEQARRLADPSDYLGNSGRAVHDLLAIIDRLTTTPSAPRQANEGGPGVAEVIAFYENVPVRHAPSAPSAPQQPQEDTDKDAARWRALSLHQFAIRYSGGDFTTDRPTVYAETEDGDEFVFASGRTYDEAMDAAIARLAHQEASARTLDGIAATEHREPQG